MDVRGFSLIWTAESDIPTTTTGTTTNATTSFDTTTQFDTTTEFDTTTMRGRLIYFYLYNPKRRNMKKIYDI